MGTTYKELFKLYDLIQNGEARSVKSFLTETQENVNIIIPCKGISVLHLAVGIDPLEKSKVCTELLLRFGGDPNLCNDDGITPVHIAAIWGRVDNLKLLLGCGGDPSRRDFEGHSAFDYAAREQQWDVYDYLHNVVDQLDDSGSKCGYTLDLERVLVTTDQMVAEYEPIIEELTQATLCRKSEMIRDWCERNSLVVNKLYPTIHSETFSIDIEYEKCINLTKNMTLDLTDRVSNQNETINSFKTCLSNRDIEISGIQHLDITSDQTYNRISDSEPLHITLDRTYDKICGTKKINESSDQTFTKTSDTQHLDITSDHTNSNHSKLNQRMSVYENFSLPGSPNNITHKNYNTKTSLKKSKNLSSNLNEKSTSNDTRSLISSDCSDLDKVLAVVQNRTNEWLSSSCEDKAYNTRRSSGSSGVSSNCSGGSIIIANVSEEYKYKDEEENVVLIERRLRVSPVVLPVDDAADSSPDQTVLSVASSLPASVQYDNNTLRAELLKLGFSPGPIQDYTRRLYLKKLQALRQTPIVVRNQGKTYSIELEKSLRSDEWMKNLSPYVDLETKARTDFTNPNKKWREGTAKTSFTYLLLDPRLTGNLPEKAGQQSQHVSWVTFVNSIFYVGKGKRSRPYSHLYQALTLWKRDFKTTKDKKVQHILDIWTDKVGVICLHIFQNVIPAEAYTNEAAMIDILGLPNLKNLKSGNYYGVAASWPLRERKMLGLYLLYKAMLIFLSEGERQLRPDDID